MDTKIVKYLYLEGWYGNGYEDDGEDITQVKRFTTQQQAVAYSIERFKAIACDYLDSNTTLLSEIAGELNGEICIETGSWRIQPESTSYGMVKSINTLACNF